MSRQERLSLFLAKEQEVLQDLLKEYFGFCGLIISAYGFSTRIKYPTQHFIQASSLEIKATDVVVEYQNLPFMANYFDFIILDHVFDDTDQLAEILAEAGRVLRPNGVLLINGFERLRLCARLLQKRFVKKTNSKRKSYSLLDLQAHLQELKFSTKVQHFDFARNRYLEKALHYVCPFLGIGFWIIAKKEVVPLKLIEDWKFTPKMVSVVDTQPEYYTPSEK